MVLANVTEEITGYLVRSTDKIKLGLEVYAVQVTARNEEWESKHTTCNELVDYRSVGGEFQMVYSGVFRNGCNVSVLTVTLLLSVLLFH